MIAWSQSQPAAPQAFDWSARDDQGRLQTGRSQAGGENQLRAQLRRRGLQALELRPVKLGRVKSMSTRELAQLTRQLAALLRAGLPLLQSLQIVARAQSHPGIVQRVEQVHADLQNGMTLAAALRRQAAGLQCTLYIALIEAGEASGRLDRAARAAGCASGQECGAWRAAFAPPCFTLLWCCRWRWACWR
jgi:type IV pilus assembly protein PilC